jgi:membrane-associated phospholipid phosphatase
VSPVSPVTSFDSFDETLNAAFEPLRGNPQVDRAAALVSNLADYGLIWVLLALIKARRRGPRRRRAIAALGVAGVSSYLVNRAVKSAVDRERPEEHLEAAVRTPSSSSFPSGHTLAAFGTAFALAESPAETAVYVGFAGAVAASRVHLRAHHPSDVMGGAVIGSVLGLALRPVLNRLTPGARRQPKRSARGMGPDGYLLKRL